MINKGREGERDDDLLLDERGRGGERKWFYLFVLDSMQVYDIMHISEAMYGIPSCYQF